MPIKHYQNLKIYENELRQFVSVLPFIQTKSIVDDIFVEMYKLENCIIIGRMVSQGYPKEKINKYYSLMMGFTNEHDFP